ncbi:MAG: D-glycero-beta-D-manno-heptose-7-phosphate kinase, partial [Candidatus Eremiobacteraeota bacterium]|nr:D-glycero-beta-D-manno-heptose-7-phosphate kinase [Candidatus Eremiobacteraeota bacterium]
MPASVLASAEARDLFERMRGKRVLVVGDVMVDEWVWGSVSRISPEAPVPVVAVSHHSFTLGGAGNVANNLRAIGATVSFAGTIGDDAEGRRVCELLDEIQVEHGAVVTLRDRPTTRKTRIVAHNQQVVRADWESSEPLESSDRAQLCAAVARIAPHYDAIVLSDYAKGLFSRDLVEAASGAPVVTADPKPKNIALFAGVTCVAPNVVEAAS